MFCLFSAVEGVAAMSKEIVTVSDQCIHYYLFMNQWKKKVFSLCI